MIKYKNIFSVALLFATFIDIPTKALAFSYYDENVTTVFIRASYEAVYQYHNPIDGAKAVPDINDEIDPSKLGTYIPNYLSNYKGMSLGVGYLSDDSIFELEFLNYKPTLVKNTEYFYLENTDPSTDAAKDKIFLNNGFKYTALFLNGYYDLLDNDQIIVPFLGIGGGIAKINLLNIKNQDYAKAYFPAFQAKIGVNLAVSDNFKPYIAYRYTYLFATKWKESIDSTRTQTKAFLTSSYKMHNVNLGLVITF